MTFLPSQLLRAASIALVLLLAPLFATAQQQLAEEISQQQTNVDTQDKSPSKSQGENGNGASDERPSTDKTVANESSTSGPDINLSDSIPVDSILNSWEKQYQDFISDLGLDSSLNARFLATGIIIFFLLLGLFISKKLTQAIRKKLYSLAKKFHVSEQKIDFYHNAVYWLFSAALLIGPTSALIVTWNITFDKYVSDSFISSALANALTVYLIVFAAAVIIDILCGLVETSFRHWSNASQSRVDTLLPIARNTVYITVATIFALMLLAEIGINVMPLLAGAGVLGFAIGFGAQTIIKDLLTGFIIILEDLIQVGDVVTLAGCTGMVEKITIRKVQLRTLDGTVFTVPFGEIAIVGNLTKEFSYAMFEIGIAYREDVDVVSDLLLTIDKNLREDDDYSNDILEPLEILGLDKFADSAVVIKARLKTQPLSQWKIGREFNRRMKKLFDQENIEIPFPHQTIYFGEDKNGRAPPLQIKDINEDNAQTSSNGEPHKDADADSKTVAASSHQASTSKQRSRSSKASSLPENDEENGDD